MGEITEDSASGRLLSTAAVAKWLAVSKPTLVRWRQSGHGPEVCWLSDGLSRDRPADVGAWRARRSRGRGIQQKGGRSHAGASR
ncbi:MAG: helix-turn-helix domain-containing protein [Bifidobacteriaceae bacterium]|jgi:hypothetical protein|nr:helix-turn-helix domain-containing protein [Bifidobacteriaceae bacterium]